MGLAIKNNIMASNAARHLSKSFAALATSVERLSSGLRINSAKDDAAGLAVRELMRADVAVIKQGSRNASDGISMIQTMEGAMAVMDENLIRMKELAEQAATGSYSTAQRVIMDSEFSEMASEIERIASNTKFNDIAMLSEAAAADNSNDLKIHVGTTTTIDVEKVDMTKSGLDIETGDGGWDVQSLTTRGVESDSHTWLTITASATGTAAGAELTIDWLDAGTAANDEKQIAVALAVTGVDTYSLASIVSQINVASQALGWDSDGNDLRYDAAEAVLDTASSKYVLKISSRESTSDSYKINLHTSATANETFTASGAFTVAALTNALTTGGNVSEAGMAAGALQPRWGRTRDRRRRVVSRTSCAG